MGKPTASAANVAATDTARAFAKNKPGWTAGALRTWYNKNAFLPAADLNTKVAERVIGLDRCPTKTGSIGVRG